MVSYPRKPKKGNGERKYDMAGHRKVAMKAQRVICIQVTVTPDEHKTLQDAAVADGRSLRQFVKWNALKAASAK